MVTRARCALVSLGVACVAVPASAAVTIQFDYTYDATGFFSGPNLARRDVLTAAASVFTSRLTAEHIAPIQPSGSNTWALTFPNPATGTNVTLNNLARSADTITIYVGARDLPGTFIGYSQYQYNYFGDASWQALFHAKDSSTRFESFGGSIAFDSLTNFYFDPNTSTQEDFTGAYDFFSLAQHEIGHLLGFTSGTMAFTANSSGATFIGPHATALYGSGIPLASSIDNSHWAQNTLSATDNVHVSMEPMLFTNTRRGFSDLDFAALQDIGYAITPRPGALDLGATSLTIATDRIVGVMTGAPGSALTIAAGAKVSSNNIDLDILAISGVFSLRPVNAVTNIASRVRSLSIAGAPHAWTGSIDLTDNPLIVQTTPGDKTAAIATLLDQVAYGRASGALPWTGTGVTSSTAAADAGHLTVALFDNADLRLSAYRGMSVDDGSLLVMVALIGDTNLDGKVDAFDLNTLAAHWQQSNVTASGGDLDASGKVDAFDLNLLASHWQATAAALSAAQADGEWGDLSQAPEPASLLLLTLPLFAPVLRRRPRAWANFL